MTCSSTKFLALLFLMGCGKTASSGHAPAPTPDPGNCPLTTPSQWTDFVKTASATDSLTSTCEEPPCDTDAYAQVDHDVREMLDRCAGVLQANPKLATCTKNLRTFIPAWLQQHDNTSFGFTSDNKAYLAAQEAPGMPAGMMTPPPEILAALPDPAKIVAAARANGWRYVVHDSALAEPPDPLNRLGRKADFVPGEGARTFIYRPDPGGKFDQWMLLNLGKEGDASVNTDLPMSFIAVQKVGPDGRPLPQIRLHFRDLNITKRGDGTFDVAPRMDGSGKCYACHVSGLRRLISYRTPVLEAKPVKGEAGYDPADTKPDGAFAFKRLGELNDVIAGYGLPDWNGTIVPEAHGPSLGAEQGCTECHNGTKRGILTVATSPDQLEKKIYFQLAMPGEPTASRLLEDEALKQPPMPGPDQAALRALLDKHDLITGAIEDSRMPALQGWLTKDACE